MIGQKPNTRIHRSGKVMCRPPPYYGAAQITPRLIPKEKEKTHAVDSDLFQSQFLGGVAAHEGRKPHEPGSLTKRDPGMPPTLKAKTARSAASEQTEEIVDSPTKKKGKKSGSKTERTADPPSSQQQPESSYFSLYEVVGAKPILVRAAFELSSDKVGELPIGTNVTVLETRNQADGAVDRKSVV